MITGPDQTPDVLLPYLARWEIQAYPASLDVWSAERRNEDGSLRYIVAPDPAQLAAKLEAAEQEQ